MAYVGIVCGPTADDPGVCLDRLASPFSGLVAGSASGAVGTLWRPVDLGGLDALADHGAAVVADRGFGGGVRLRQPVATAARGRAALELAVSGLGAAAGAELWVVGPRGGGVDAGRGAGAAL